ncbi:MAG: zinc ribbon domain-containing protein [Nanoarchaeota archaeon]
MDPNFVQKRMNEIQSNQGFVDAFSKIVSGKAGYKAVIEKKPVIIKCTGCGKILEEVKFCPDCGTKVWIKPTNCPKCTKPVADEDKFCQDCGESLSPPGKLS